MKSDLSGAVRTFNWPALPNGWQFDLLGNRCSIRRGASPRPAGDPKYFGGNIPWFKIGDATKTGSRFLSTTEEFVNEAGAACSVRVPAGSLIVANSGVSLGFAVITELEGCIHDGWLHLSDFKGADRDYLYYAVNFVTKGIRNVADGTTQPNLNTDIARHLLLPFPSIREQQAISSLFGALDDKIELNRRMSQTLEAIARAIFAEMSKTAEPDSIENPFATIAQISRESVNPGEYPEESFDHYSIPAFDEQRLPTTETGKQIKSNKFMVYDDSVLLSKLNPRIPRIWLPSPSEDNRSICSTEFLVLRPRFGYSREFIYGVCTSPDFQQTFATMVTGTSGSHQRVKPEYLEKMPIHIPDPEAVNKFTEAVRPLHARVANNLRENTILASLRDTLLPKLISGEIRIPQADKQIEAHA